MRGQAFDTFKILIGAVFAIVLLVMVYSIVSGYSSPIDGMETTKKVVLAAFNAPGECISANAADFSAEEELSSASFSTPVTLHSATTPVDCSPPDRCVFSSKVRIAVSAKCSFDGTQTICDVYLGSRDCTY
jgi:hypothetical protein